MDCGDQGLRNHTFKTGIQVDDLEGNISQPPQGRGDFSFNGSTPTFPTASPDRHRLERHRRFAGDAGAIQLYTMADGVNYVGGMNSFSGSNIAATDDHRWYIGAYFQDDWKVNPQADAESRPALGSVHALRRNPRATRPTSSPAGGNGTTGTYYMSKQGCAVARAAIFNTVAACSNITIDCNAGLDTGQCTRRTISRRA